MTFWVRRFETRKQPLRTPRGTNNMWQMFYVLPRQVQLAVRDYICNMRNRRITHPYCNATL